MRVKCVRPIPHASVVTVSTPIRIDPLTFQISSATISPNPSNASAVLGFLTLPSCTSVSSLFTTSPALVSPINAMNNPIPQATAAYNSCGIALRMSCRMPNAVSSRNTVPERKTAPSAVCHGICILRQTV